MIIYLLIGTFWTMFLEYLVKPIVYGEEMNWPTRIFNMILWPINVGLFIYGYFKGRNSKENDESEE